MFTGMGGIARASGWSAPPVRLAGVSSVARSAQFLRFKWGSSARGAPRLPLF